MSKKDDRFYLLHIRDAILQIEEYAKLGSADFLKDKKTQDAVIRQFEILGEATKGLSPTLTKKHPDVPWKRIAGMRDKMIHEYFGVNMELVWDVIEKNLPALKKDVKEILGDL